MLLSPTDLVCLAVVAAFFVPLLAIVARRAEES